MTHPDNAMHGARAPESSVELTALLCRGLSRLAIVAQGNDGQLDSVLAELRHHLRGDLRDIDALARLIEALGERIRTLAAADPVAELQRILAELAGTLHPRAGADVGLADLHGRLGQQATLVELVSLAGELAARQSRPVAVDSRWPWFARWRRDHGLAEVDAHPAPPPATGVDARHRSHDHPGHSDPRDEIERCLLPQRDTEQLYADARQLLAGLLRQIEPPPLAADNYRQARERLDHELDAGSLGATLEDVCQVVAAAIESDRGEFQQFLLMLNQRLLEVHAALAASQEAELERRTAGDQLQATVTAELQVMEGQLAGATSLDGLKADVTRHLNAIAQSVAAHRQADSGREAELRQQLDQLGAQLVRMESDADRIRQRMAEQRQRALLDALTQLPNRQCYEERVQQEWLRRNQERPLMLALCDVDNFKQINDSFGHLAGDKVLRVIARTLRARLRRGDLCARFGGEEFVLLLPATEPETAWRLLEEMREAVAECPFRFRDQPVAVTLSAGLASAAGCQSPQQLFQRADEALYRAKQDGRNRCVTAVAQVGAA